MYCLYKKSLFSYFGSRYLRVDLVYVCTLQLAISVFMLEVHAFYAFHYYTPSVTQNNETTMKMHETTTTTTTTKPRPKIKCIQHRVLFNFLFRIPSLPPEKDVRVTSAAFFKGCSSSGHCSIAAFKTEPCR